jgi:hypothetical protein
MHEMKEEVILSILAQESMKSELRLRRYGEKKLWEPIWNFWKVPRCIFGNIIENLRVLLKFCGLQVNYKKNQGPLCNILGIIDFLIFF